MLWDVCSIANTIGGQMVFGVKEEKGTAIPEEICGIETSSPDLIVRQLEETIRTCTEEIISGVHCHYIRLKENVYVFVLQIPMSLSGPHRVKIGLDKDHRFYGRSTKKKIRTINYRNKREVYAQQ